MTVDKVVDREARQPSRLTPPEGVEDFDLENMEVLRTARLYSCTLAILSTYLDPCIHNYNPQNNTHHTLHYFVQDPQQHSEYVMETFKYYKDR